MRKFTTTKTHGHFGFVAIFQKLAQLAQLNVVITNFSPWPELDFLNFRALLFFLGTLLLLAVLELEFAKIHNAAQGRFCIR